MGTHRDVRATSPETRLPSERQTLQGFAGIDWSQSTVVLGRGCEKRTGRVEMQDPTQQTEGPREHFLPTRRPIT
jgi:hypothetical protein